MILGLVDEAVKAGARQSKACEVLGMDSRTVQRWRRRGVGEDGRAGPRSTPRNKLSPAERAELLRILNSPKYRDLSPNQIVPMLAEEGRYVASESTMYRILREEGQVSHRERSRAPQPRLKPAERVATGPNQVWSWDITYLKSRVRGSFFYLYLVVDVWSRKVVGWAVHESECSKLASELMVESIQREGAGRGLVLHSDNGAPMKGATLLATLRALGVQESFSRPRVSDDNPFSESLFRTVKYRPGYPSVFDSLGAAIEWVEALVRWYNTEHRHSGIKFVTPEDRHMGRDVAILRARDAAYREARRQHPDRWSGATRDWTPVEEVRLHPFSPDENAVRVRPSTYRGPLPAAPSPSASVASARAERAWTDADGVGAEGSPRQLSSSR